MDLFTLMIAFVIMLFALMAGQKWIIFGTIILIILSTRSVRISIVIITGTILLFYFQESLGENWPLLMFGLMILALILGFKTESAPPEYYQPGLGTDIFGGS